MLPRAQLDEVLATVPTRPEAGLWARAVAHEHLQSAPPGAPSEQGPQPLWPGGPPLWGARYTAKAGAPAIYLAESADVALLEIEAVVAIGGRSVLSGARPFTVLQVQVQLTSVLDLRDEELRKLLGTNLQELTGNWRLAREAPTQVLGAAVAANPRFEGLLAPSAKQPRSVILVVFAERLKASRGSFCEIVLGGALGQRIPPRT